MPANLAVLHPAVGAPSSLRAPRWGRPRGERTRPITAQESFPGVTPRPWPQGMLSAPREPPGRGDRRLDRVGSNLRTELAQSPSPTEKAQRGRWETGRGEGREWGASPLQGSASEGHFPGSCDVSKNCKETPLSGCSFAQFVSLAEVPHFGCPGLGGGLVTLHLKQVWGYCQTCRRVDNAPRLVFLLDLSQEKLR